METTLSIKSQYFNNKWKKYIYMYQKLLNVFIYYLEI